MMMMFASTTFSANPKKLSRSSMSVSAETSNSRSVFKQISFLCLLAICSTAAASGESQAASAATPKFTTPSSSTGSGSAVPVPVLVPLEDNSNSNSASVVEGEHQSLWSQQPPKVALLETSSKILTSSTPATSNSNSNSNSDSLSTDQESKPNNNDKTNSLNNAHSSLNNNNNNNNNNAHPQDALNSNYNADTQCRPSMAEMCRPLLAAQEMDAGQVCIEVQDGQVSVQVQANEFWTILEASVWMAPYDADAAAADAAAKRMLDEQDNNDIENGHNRVVSNNAPRQDQYNLNIHVQTTPSAAAAAAAPQTIPLKDGRLDLTAFTTSSQPNLQSASWKTTMTSTVDCTLNSSSRNTDHHATASKDASVINGNEEEQRATTMVVRVMMAEVNDDGNVIPGTEEIAFAYGQVATASANYEEDSIYGFMSLSLDCPCTTAPAAVDTTSQEQSREQQNKQTEDMNAETYVARRFDAPSSSSSTVDINIDADTSSLSQFSSFADQRRLAFSASQSAFHRRFDAAGQQHRVLQTQVEEECFYAFAYYSSDSEQSSSTCLSDLGYDYQGAVDETGWTNGPYQSSFTPYRLRLLTNAPECDIGNATQIGTVTVLLDGELVTIDYNLDPALKYTLRETDFYAGLDRKPPSSASLPNHHEFGAGSDPRLQDSFVVDNFELGDDIYVVAGAKICRAPPNIYVPGISKPCLPTRSHSGKECYPLLAGPTIDAGQMCLEIVRQGGPMSSSYVLQVAFSTFGDWVLDSVSFWLGTNYTDVPTLNDSEGSLPNEQAFPYFFCNFTGSTTWETTVPLNLTEHCFDREDFTLAMVARSAVVQQDYDGQEIDGSKAVAFAFEHPGHDEDQVVPEEEWFAWLDFKVDCDCSKPPPDVKAGTESAPVCVQTADASGEECVPLVIDQTDEAGTVCLKVIGHDRPVLELTYHSTDYYSLIQNHFWVGLASLEEIPVQPNGSPDVDLFPYYWCDYAGDDTWQTPIPAINLTLACQSENLIKFVAIAHASVEEEVYVDGHLVEGSKHNAFAYEQDGENSATWFGWFNFTIDCDCHLKPTPAPTTSISPSALPSFAPTTSPQPSASAVPTTSPAPSISSSPSSEPSGELDEWYPCYHVWAYHPTAAVRFTDIGVSNEGWTNGHFDLYACGSCECPTCSSGKPLCDEINSPVTPLDPCTCVCPEDEYEEPNQFDSAMVEASIPSPITMELYAESTAEGMPKGQSYGNLTVAFSDNVATVTFSVADSVWFVFTESDFYMAEERLPNAANGNLDLSKFGNHEEYEAPQMTHTEVVSSYDFYAAGHARICDLHPAPVPTVAPSLTTAPTPTPSGAPSQQTDKPSMAPTTDAPTVASGHPSATPTTGSPTTAPTGAPTGSPTEAPTGAPTDSPAAAPTGLPTVSPTAVPTGSPTGAPTGIPTTQDPSTQAPTVASGHPSATPTTGSPTSAPTRTPTINPTVAPTTPLTGYPTRPPTGSPTIEPTGSPTSSPTNPPTGNPITLAPTTDAPTVASGHPSITPTTGSPTSAPTKAPQKKPNWSPNWSPHSLSYSLPFYEPHWTSKFLSY